MGQQRGHGRRIPIAVEHQGPGDHVRTASGHFGLRGHRVFGEWRHGQCRHGYRLGGPGTGLFPGKQDY